MELELLRIDTDFQAMDSDESLFILRINGIDIENLVSSLNIKIGDKVLLDAGEDFELTGILSFKFVEALKKDAWVALPDWSQPIFKD